MIKQSEPLNSDMVLIPVNEFLIKSIIGNWIKPRSLESNNLPVRYNPVPLLDFAVIGGHRIVSVLGCSIRDYDTSKVILWLSYLYFHFHAS